MATQGDEPDEFCGYAEIRSPTRTNLWDHHATDASVGDKCVGLFHWAGEGPAKGEMVCVRRSEISTSCSGADGKACMAECDGDFVDQMN